MASTFYPRSNTSTYADALIFQWWRDHVQAVIDAGRHEDAKGLYLDLLNISRSDLIQASSCCSRAQKRRVP